MKCLPPQGHSRLAYKRLRFRPNNVLLLLLQLCNPLRNQIYVHESTQRRTQRRTCLRSSFLRAISAAFSSFDIPSLLGAARGEGDNAVGNAAPSLGAGDANGVDRGLVDGVSAAMREGRPACVEGVRAGLTVNEGDDVSSVTGMGTAGGAGSSNAPHGSSSSTVPPQPPTALRRLDGAGALSNASIAMMVG